MTLVFAVIHLYNLLLFASVYFYILFFLNLTLINQTEESTIPACPSLIYFLLTGAMSKDFLRKISADVCACISCFIFVSRLIL